MDEDANYDLPIVFPKPLWVPSSDLNVTVEDIPARFPRGEGHSTSKQLAFIARATFSIVKKVAKPQSTVSLSSSDYPEPLIEDLDGTERNVAVVYPWPMIPEQVAVTRTHRNVVRVISDLHLGSSWHTEQSHEALLMMLAEMCDPRTCVHTLVLNGDVIEAWIHSPDAAPPSPAEYFTIPDVAEVVGMLQAIAANGIKVFVLRGNHDDELPIGDLGRGFGPTIAVIDADSMVINGVRITHGHEYDLFCRRTPTGKRSISYFMSRGLAQSGSLQSAPNKLIQTAASIADDTMMSTAMYFMNFRAVLTMVLQQAMSTAWMSSWTNIRDESILVRDGEALTVKEIVQEYVGVIGETRSRWGIRRAAEMVRSSVSGVYTNFVRSSPYLVELFGHSHIPALSTHGRRRVTHLNRRVPRALDTPVVYANTGSFTHGQATYVDVVMGETSFPTMTWDAGLPPYLFGQQDLRTAAAFVDTEIAPPQGISVHMQGRVVGGRGSWRVDPVGRLTLPYEVRLMECREGTFQLSKASRVPYSWDWSSRRSASVTGPARGGGERQLVRYGTDGGAHAVPAMGAVNQLVWHGPAIKEE